MINFIIIIIFVKVVVIWKYYSFTSIVQPRSKMAIYHETMGGCGISTKISGNN